MYVGSQKGTKTMHTETDQAAENEELTVLKLLASETDKNQHVETTCSRLADQLGVSVQTVSRRLRRLEQRGLLNRDSAHDRQVVAITATGLATLRREYEQYQQVSDREPETNIEYSGSVQTGMGEGSQFISLQGYTEQFCERLGYDPFPGTLNIELTEKSIQRRSALEGTTPVPIDGWSDDKRTFGPVKCYPTTIETASGKTYEPAHIVVPERTDHDEDQLEVIAPDELRDRLDLTDGDSLTVHV